MLNGGKWSWVVAVWQGYYSLFAQLASFDAWCDSELPHDVRGRILPLHDMRIVVFFLSSFSKCASVVEHLLALFSLEPGNLFYLYLSQFFTDKMILHSHPKVTDAEIAEKQAL